MITLLAYIIIPTILYRLVKVTAEYAAKHMWWHDE